MNPELQKEVLARLDAVAAKLGVAAGYLWAVLLRQARIAAIEDTLWAVISFAALVWLVSRVKRIQAWVAADEDGDHNWIWIPFGVGALLALVIFCESLGGALTEWANPGYWAWTTLMEKLG